MHINNNAQANQIYQMQNIASNTSEHASGTTIQNKTTTKTDTVSISNAGFNAKSNWQKIADEYDVQNISQNEIGSMVSSLTDNKLISSTDGLYLMAPTSMNQDPEVKYDLLASMRKRLASAIANGSSPEHIKNTESALNIIEELKALSN